MAKLNTAWGIEIGQYGVKALQLERVGDEVRVRDFAVIPHVQVLTDPEISSDGDAGAASKYMAMLEMSLAALATQKQLTGQRVVVNFNWMQGRGFARFAKLPAVSPREIPNLVKYEVDQQIPFPVDDIEWDYHTFISRVARGRGRPLRDPEGAAERVPRARHREARHRPVRGHARADRALQRLCV